MKTLIKRANGSTRGYLMEAGDRVLVQSANGSTLGWYIKSQDKTFDRSGNMVGSGDQTGILFED